MFCNSGSCGSYWWIIIIAILILVYGCGCGNTCGSNKCGCGNTCGC